MKNVLELKRVCQEWKLPKRTRNSVLEDLSFHIPKGSLTGFIGVNGAGKTTTIKTIFEFIPKVSGEILFFDDQYLSLQVRSRIGFLPERPYFYDFLTGREFLLLQWKLQGHFEGRDFEERCNAILKLVDLERGKNMRLRQFSKGMLQRIGIAQSLLHRPEFLVWDEPMSGLDPDGRYMVKQIMKSLHDDGTTLFFSSHLLQDMQELCDRLVVIDQGKILYNGAVENLIKTETHPKELAWRWPGQNGITIEVVNKDKLGLRLDEIRSLGGEIQWIERRHLSLDEAFRELRIRNEQPNDLSSEKFLNMEGS